MFKILNKGKKPAIFLNEDGNAEFLGTVKSSVVLGSKIFADTDTDPEDIDKASDGTIKGAHIKGGSITGTTIKTSETGAAFIVDKTGLIYTSSGEALMKQGWAIEPSGVGGALCLYINGAKKGEIVRKSGDPTVYFDVANSSDQQSLDINAGYTAKIRANEVHLGSRTNNAIYANSEVVADTNYVNSIIKSAIQDHIARYH